jgi:pimeloyl-ACP methyl ester carboxylesterase
MTEEGRAGLVAWHEGLAALKQAPRAAREAHARREHPTWSDEAIALWADTKEQVSLDIFAPLMDTRADWREPMRQIACPTLLITGDGSLGGMVAPAVAQEIQTLNPHVEVAQIANAGHSIRYDQPAAYLAAVREFLARRY